MLHDEPKRQMAYRVRTDDLVKVTDMFTGSWEGIFCSRVAQVITRPDDTSIVLVEMQGGYPFITSGWEESGLLIKEKNDPLP